jgi:tetratricopeptide (TPR) repeat protein
VTEEAGVARARQLMQLGRNDEALAALVPTLDARTADPTAWCLAAACDLNMNRVQRALAAADYAVSLDPASEWGHRLRSIALSRMGRPREAIEAATEAVRLAPHFAHAHIALAEAYLAYNRSDRALAEASEAVRCAPHLPDAYYLRGRVEQRLARYSDAEASYRRALEIDPDHASARNNLGVVALRQGRSAEAATHFVGSAIADPRSKTAAGNVAVAAAAFLVKLSWLAFGGVLLAIALWAWSQGAGGSALLDHVIRPLAAVASAAVIGVVGWRGARLLPRTVLRSLRTPRLAWLVFGIVVQVVGIFYFAFATSLAWEEGYILLRLVLFGNFLTVLANRRRYR